ncbi:hypothetical protein LOK49_LG04G02999 [Camellia lanceoleosa]|uniref:Uncharacterized protein n=1 Tax=Camellia lanceoleosa TaxID=1840588 RepID=A0ACC0I4A4_9ERIC|nr:hypothetical protein LOK49_LG04G02999 [Camellia lanceoleosa]
MFSVSLISDQSFNHCFRNCILSLESQSLSLDSHFEEDLKSLIDC